ncbi:MAG: hypothetical protein MUO39_15020, partial [Steroidobacteraceae bacterium]|nr:hypothetical protein [Steroidobacteraceae bacterium]
MMRQLIARLAMLALLGAALAGCGTTKSKDDYSSLPPSGQHPTGKAYPARPGGTIPGGLGAEELPSDQYTDLFDRIRAGYAIPDIDHYGVDREVESYRSSPYFLDRTFKRGSRYLYFIVTELER